MLHLAARLRITFQAIAEVVRLVWLSNWAKDPGAVYVQGVTRAHLLASLRAESRNELQELLRVMGEHCQRAQVKRPRTLRS